MQVNNKVLEALDEYHFKSLLMQNCLYDKIKQISMNDLSAMIDDDLIFHVPIYDMLDRKYASFSSFPEALNKKGNDPKGNGIRFENHNISEINFITLLYLFRLCGSGINYVPKTHGFGNFWIVPMVESGVYDRVEWLNQLPDKKFSNNKGYLLPQFSIGLKDYILTHAVNLVDFLINYVQQEKRNIIDVVNHGNLKLKALGFQRQNFVLSAFAADLAEYFPNYVDPWSMIYAGSNAKKCIKSIFGKCREEDAIDFLSKRYNSPPYSVEDSRLCDPVRYFLEYQSKFHIEVNNGITYSNNTLLKKSWTTEEYQSFLLQLQK